MPIGMKPQMAKVADKQPIAKKMHRKNGKGTSPKAMPRKETLHPRSVRNRSRSPLVWKRPPRGLPAGQVPAEMHIPIMALEQVLLAPLEDAPIGEVYGFRVLPLIIPSGLNPNWICMESKLTIYPGDIVYGKHSDDWWIRMVSIAGPK